MWLKKELAEYLRGERNAVKDEFILSRQRAGDILEMISVLSPEIREPIYVTWRNLKAKRKKYRALIDETDAGLKVNVYRAKPRGTGGKKPYIILMQSKMQNPEPLPTDAAGLLFNLMYCGCVEWHTGRVIRKRDGKPMSLAMICGKLGIGKARLKRAISSLTTAGIMTYNKAERAYFISREFAKKGRGRGGDED